MFLEKNPRYTPHQLARSPTHHAHSNFGPPVPSLLQNHRNRNSCYGINSCYGFTYDLVLVMSSMTSTDLFKKISLIETVLLRREVRKHLNWVTLICSIHIEMVFCSSHLEGTPKYYSSSIQLRF